jgi:hypothetical protein
MAASILCGIRFIMNFAEDCNFAIALTGNAFSDDCRT